MMDLLLFPYNFRGKKMGDSGAKAMEKFFSENEIAHLVNLSDNQIGPEGLKSIATAMEKNKALGVLNLSQNSVGSKGVEHLSNCLKKMASSIQFTFLRMI